MMQALDYSTSIWSIDYAQQYPFQRQSERRTDDQPISRGKIVIPAPALVILWKSEGGVGRPV